MNEANQIKEAERHGAWASPVPPPGAAADWTVPQHWDELTDEDHWVWDTLFARQTTLLHGRAVHEFEEGLEVLHLSRPGIPNFDELNEKLGARTGWKVVAVPGLVPDDVFFSTSASAASPPAISSASRASSTISRSRTSSTTSSATCRCSPSPQSRTSCTNSACLGCRRCRSGSSHRVARLYWYTVEFGLALEHGKPRIYGAGILSSFGESHYSLESAKPHRLAFDLKRVLRTRYRTDAFQQTYFVIDRFEDALKLLRENDFAAVCASWTGCRTSIRGLRTRPSCSPRRNGRTFPVQSMRPP